jgi:DNA-binding PadR family transcriptional regulator
MQLVPHLDKASLEGSSFEYRLAREKQTFHLCELSLGWTRLMRARMAAKKTTTVAATQRAMTSQVNWAVLGLVIERPGYGYELAQRFDREYGEVLLVSGSHIYAALNELQRREFIEEIPGSRTIQSGGRRQPKPRTRATAKGVNSFRERLFSQMREDRRQSWMFLRQLAVFAHVPEVALRIIGQLEQAYADEARTASAGVPDGSGMDVVSGLVARLAAEESRLAMEGKLPWLRYARREFEALARDRAREESR